MKVETDAVEGERELLVTVLYIWTYGSLDLSLSLFRHKSRRRQHY